MCLKLPNCLGTGFLLWVYHLHLAVRFTSSNSCLLCCEPQDFLNKIKSLLVFKGHVDFWLPFQMLPDQTRSSSELSGKSEKEDPDIPSDRERETGILGNKTTYSEFPLKITINPYLKEVTASLWCVRVVNIPLYYREQSC